MSRFFFAFCLHCSNVCGRFSYIWKVLRVSGFSFYLFFLLLLKRHRFKRIANDLISLLFEFMDVYNFLFFLFPLFLCHLSDATTFQMDTYRRRYLMRGETTTWKMNCYYSFILPFQLSSYTRLIEFTKLMEYTSSSSQHRLTAKTHTHTHQMIKGKWMFQSFVLLNFPSFR